MRPAIVLVSLLALAACATPREACISSVSRDLRVVNNLIAETQANLARGYALETRQDVVNTTRTCRTKQPDGSILRYECPDVEIQDRRVPVAIDLNAEQAKLRSLQQRQREMQAQVNTAVQQCIAANPE